ncbi:MAG: zinc-ribbon domain-containing protein [Clostridia bacterium]|nr:zinc-ribbon domain-containing protein [Clostridia bacterium]
MNEALQFLIGFVVFIWIIGLGVGVLLIIASWKLFEKAGEPGWAILVPFYNTYVFFKISWGNGLYFLLSICPALGYMIASYALTLSVMRASLGNSLGLQFSEYTGYAWAFGLMLVFLLMTFVVSIITYVKLAKAFGQGGGFACGLIFLYPVFICIIAFSKDIHYVGISGKTAPYGAGANYAPNGYRQQGYQSPYYQPNTQQYWQNPYAPQGEYQAPSSEGTAFCPECGTPLNQDVMFCPNCGTPRQK